MFTLPQPLADTPVGTPPHVDVEESAKTWENIVQTTVYPMPHPVINNIADLESLLLAAKKYEMQPIVDIHHRALENLMFIQEDPFRPYAVACVSVGWRTRRNTWPGILNS